MKITEDFGKEMQERKDWLHARVIPNDECRGYDIALVVDGTYSARYSAEEQVEYWTARIESLMANGMA